MADVDPTTILSAMETGDPLQDSLNDLQEPGPIPNLALVKSEYDADTDCEQEGAPGEVSEPTSVMSEHEQHNQHSSDVRNNLMTLTSTLQEKGSQLWSELSLLLVEYKAELQRTDHMKFAPRTKIESMQDVEDLRNEIVLKDNENLNLKHALSQMEARNQTVQMDISVKDSLLKKYQQDLMEKESAVLSLQSTNQKLESRISLLETKLQQRPTMTSPSKPMTSPGRGFGNMRGGLMRGGMGMKKRSLPMTGMQGLSPAKRSPMKSFTPRTRQPTPVRLGLGHSPRMPTATPRLPTSAPMRLPTPMRSPPPMRLPTAPPTSLPQQIQQSSQQQALSQPQQQEPPGQIVCIELDDDDEISEVNQATEQVDTKTENPNDSLYTEQWQEPKNEPDYFDQNFQGQGSQQDFSDVQGPLMMPGTSDGGMDTSGAGMLFDAEGLMNVPGASPGKQDAGRKVVYHQCCLCAKMYPTRANLRRHIHAVHGTVRRFQCPFCDRPFNDKSNYRRHLKSTHPQLENNPELLAHCLNNPGPPGDLDPDSMPGLTGNDTVIEEPSPGS